jgi:cell division protein FtsB
MTAIEILRFIESYAKDLDRPIVVAVIIVLSIFLLIRRFYESEYVHSGKQQHKELRELYEDLQKKYEKLETRHEELKSKCFQDARLIEELRDQLKVIANVAQ